MNWKYNAYKHNEAQNRQKIKHIILTLSLRAVLNILHPLFSKKNRFLWE